VWALAQSRGVGHRSLVTPEKVLSEYNESGVDRVPCAREQVWGQSHHPPEANGGRCDDFTAFSKKYAFLDIFWYKFVLKMRF